VLELILLLVIRLDGSVMFNLHAKSGCMRALLGLGRVAVWSCWPSIVDQSSLCVSGGISGRLVSD
jgi:hypothetical protein